jgi:hypothetical protein
MIQINGHAHSKPKALDSLKAPSKSKRGVVTFNMSMTSTKVNPITLHFFCVL